MKEAVRGLFLVDYKIKQSLPIHIIVHESRRIVQKWDVCMLGEYWRKEQGRKDSETCMESFSVCA